MPTEPRCPRTTPGRGVVSADSCHPARNDNSLITICCHGRCPIAIGERARVQGPIISGAWGQLELPAIHPTWVSTKVRLW